jgi:surface antigen/LysM repeat protein
LLLGNAKAEVGKQLTVRSKKARKFVKKRIIRNGFLLVNAAVLLAIVAVVVANPNSSKEVRSGAYSQAANSTIVHNPLDELSSAAIAAQVAQIGRLAEVTAVVNQADSEQEQLSIVTSSNQTVSKPQIVSTDLKSKKDIRTHTVVAGDTVSSVAATYGITSDSLRWSNNITGEALPKDKVLWVPPVSGIVYEVKQLDTVDSLAARFRANKDQIIADNDAEVNGLVVGDRVLIRDGSVPAPAPAVARVASWSGPRGDFNGYDYGYCTWWVATRRVQIGRPVPTQLGNASTWYSRARNTFGIPTGSEPQSGAAVMTSSVGYGHVAFVESVNEDGSFVMSEMNANNRWNVQTTRTVSAAEAARYYYIY